MTSVIDPFKVRTYGEKKSIDAKEERIQKLLEENKRYYPVEKNGNVNEWAAVIKHQTEQFEHQQNLLSKYDQIRKRQYAEELQNEIDRKKIEKSFEGSIAEREGKQVNDRKYAQDSIHNLVRNQEHMLKFNISQMNKKQVNDCFQNKNLQKEIELDEGKRQRNEAYKNEQIHREIMQMKKQAIAQQIKDDLDQKQKLKHLDRVQYQMEKEEANQMFQDNSQKQIQRELDYKERYIRFNEQEKMKQQAFMNSIGFSNSQQPRDKNMRLSQSFDGTSILKRLHDTDQTNQNFRQNTQNKTSDVQKFQMNQKQQVRVNEKEKVTVEQQRLKDQYRELAMNEERIKDERKRQQAMYRDILNSQVNFTKEVTNNYGNMTSVEKKMNKNDLLAFKNYEKQQFALVPGFRTNNQQFAYSPPQYKQPTSDYSSQNMNLLHGSQKISNQNLNQSADINYQNHSMLNHSRNISDINQGGSKREFTTGNNVNSNNRSNNTFKQVASKIFE